MTDDVDTFRRLADAIPDALVRFDRDGRLTYCNRGFATMYGIDPSDIVGRIIAKITPPERSKLILETIEQVFTTGQVAAPRELFTGRDFEVETEARCVPELGADGNVESVLVILRDVSGLRRAERALRASEERFEMMVRYSSDIITILEPDGSWRYSSPEGSRLLGFPEGYDPEGGIFALIHPDDVGYALGVLQRCLDGDLRADELVEFRVIAADGSERIVESVVQNLVENRAVRGVVINSRDVTERHRADEERRLSEESLRILADAVPVGIFDVSVDGTRNFANRYLRELRGDKVDDPAGAWRDLVHPDDHSLVRDAFIEAVTTTSMVTVRHRLRDTTLDEQTGWVELRLAPLVDADGVVARILGSVTDVSVAVETERTLAAARDAALEASRLKSQFLANVSHEIRTPLNAILGMSALLLDEDLSREQLDRLITLRSAGTQLLELLEDVLDLSRIEADQLELDNVSVDLRQVVSEAVGLFLASAHEKRLAIRLEGADVALPLVMGDPLRIRQILVNLVGNAVKFTERGSVTVRVMTTHRLDGGVDCRFDVTDTGLGIDPTVRDRLFEPFRQGDASTTRRHGGTGLGLAITHQLVEMMGGAIEVAGDAGTGSRFTVVIPFTPAPVDARRITRPLPARQLGDGASRAAGMHVLVAEDNDVNRQVITAYLTKLGCTFEAVNDGPEAVDAACLPGARFDVVLMDCQMPEMDGFEATRRIRRAEASAAALPVRIVAVTAGAMEGERERCFAAGMDDYLAKPFTLAGLEQVLFVPGGTGGTGGRGAGRPGRAGLAGLAEVPDAVADEAVALVRAIVPKQLDVLRRAIVNGPRNTQLASVGAIRGAAEAIGALRLVDAAAEMEGVLDREATAVVLASAFDLVERAWRAVDDSLA